MLPEPALIQKLLTSSPITARNCLSRKSACDAMSVAETRKVRGLPVNRDEF